jgi:hypothetical protein
VFIDSATLPLHLETLLDLLKEFPEENFSRKKIFQLLQPDGIADNNNQAKYAIDAAKELNLIKEKNKIISRVFDINEHSRELILSALDSHVFNDQKIEPYFAPFYSYLLSKGDTKGLNANRKNWVDDYNDEKGGRDLPNPFNVDKSRTYFRWYTYVGLGWRDPSEEFQTYPYERIKRNLDDIFNMDKNLAAKEFFKSLGAACPELDGGVVFDENKSKIMPGNIISLGVSQALITLHEEKVITLFCPNDSTGPSIANAEPPRDGNLVSDRLSRIKLNS